MGNMCKCKKNFLKFLREKAFKKYKKVSTNIDLCTFNNNEKNQDDCGKKKGKVILLILIKTSKLDKKCFG